MADYPEVVYWLTLIQASGLKLNIVKPMLQRWCVAEQRPAAELIGLSPLEWSTTFGLTDSEANLAVKAREKLAGQAESWRQWQAAGLELLILTDPRYPRRLQRVLPPAQQPLLLWAQGPLDLLNLSGVAMLGDDPTTGSPALSLEDLLQSLVADDIALISGYGRGLDRTAFDTILKLKGGQALVVLPMGLTAFGQSTTRLEPALAAGQIGLVSPFPPQTAYQERLAEARNLLIDHLALTLLILDSSEEAKGRAEAALNRGQPVFVSLNDTANNRTLIDQGALLLTDAGEVVEMVQQAVIDAALLDSDEELDEAPTPSPSGPTAAPAATLMSDPDEAYSLRFEAVDPMSRAEALEILSLGGEIPALLRQRLNVLDDEEEQDE